MYTLQSYLLINWTLTRNFFISLLFWWLSSTQNTSSILQENARVRSKIRNKCCWRLLFWKNSIWRFWKISFL